MMFDLEKTFERIGESFAPHFDRFRTVADARICQVLAYLDTIARNTETQDFDERVLPRWQYVTANVTDDLLNVPPGTEWILETVGALDACTVTITDQGNYVYVHQFSTPDTDTPGIRLRGGAQLEITTTGNSNPVKIFVQVKMRQPRQSSPATNAGQFQQLPTVKYDESTGRHAGDGLVQGTSVNG